MRLAQFVVFGGLLLSTVALASPPILKIKSVDKPLPNKSAEVTVDVDRGSVKNNTAIELLAPTGKAAGVIVLPDGIGEIRKGMSVRRVVIQGAGPVAPGAYLSTPGAFADFAAADKDWKMVMQPAGASPNAGKTDPDALRARSCPFREEELNKVFDVPFRIGRSNQTPFTGGESLSCYYESPRMTLMVEQTFHPSTGPQNTGRERAFAGNFEAIPRDPDVAAWQVAQGDLTHVALHYTRPGVNVHIRILSGVDMKNKAAVDAARAKVLSLRRIP